MGIVIFIVMLMAIVGFMLFNSYNRLVTLRHRYLNAYKQIEVQLQRRYDLIPNLVETAKAYMQHEKETLAAVIAARNTAVASSRQAARNPADPQAIQELETAEASLNGALSRLFVVSESYPELKADRTMGQLMEELTSTENRIAFARQSFNDAVTLYNTQLELFPSNLIAQNCNFTPGELLEAVAPEVKQVPRVSF